MKDNTPLKEAVMTGDWNKVDPSKITLEDFIKIDELGKSYIYYAKINKTTHKFPKELIGNSGIIWKDPTFKQYTLLALATEGQIKLAPQYAISKKSLTQRNEQGTTLIHYIACFDSIKDIEPKLLTSKTLMIKSFYNSTPLEVACQQLKKFLNSPTSRIPKKNSENIKRLRENISLIVKKLDLKDLESNRWDKDALPYIKAEITKRRTIQKIVDNQKNLEI